ncbi:MAG: gamma-glutamyltransferase [Dehalococcoidia bacterium]|nr:gamma-glutamyltransferase [Dehalococcoidia bacterium]MSQ17963.1 gamma-glutamyltransferase [Dehalococcoidia bacterium]
MFFDSRRSTVLAKRGMVATSQPLAAQAGLQMLMQGGNAVDAAVAAAAVLNVVEPESTGVGGDMFALVWDNRKKQVYALNGSGRAPGAASIAELRGKGHRQMPQTGVYSVTVPGTVHGWETISQAHGAMPLAQVLQSAIDYAEEGFPVSDIIANQWSSQGPKLARLPSGQEFLLNGRPPRHGEVMRLPTLARTLRTIAEGGAEAFYTGDIGQRTAAFVQEQGGWLSSQDLAGHTSDWDEPISANYRGVTCWECPPNGQGIAALEALNIAEGIDLKGMGLQSTQTYHHLIESMRLAFADAFRYVADPRAAQVPIAQLTDKEYAARRRGLINPKQAMTTAPYGKVMGGSDTVYISAVDGQGNACSFINSIYVNFGAGLVVPGTGIVLHNRGALFSLDANHPNALAPGKRPFHTIIPALATVDGELSLCYGVMGGLMQPQGHLQVIANMVDFGLDPQEALNALRFQVVEDAVYLEEGVPSGTVQELTKMGHQVQLVTGYQRVGMGGGQVIHRDPDTGVLRGGSEPRKDGCAVGW